MYVNKSLNMLIFIDFNFFYFYFIFCVAVVSHFRLAYCSNPANWRTKRKFYIFHCAMNSALKFIQQKIAILLASIILEKKT